MRPIIPLLTAALTATPLLAAQNGWVETYQTFGTEAGSSYGFSIAGIADVDGDGTDDFLVGAMGQDSNGRNSGAVFVRSGADGALIRRVDGEFAGNYFGATLADVGDLNGDTVPEFVAGAPYYSGGIGGFLAGRIYVVDGSNGVFLDQLDGLSVGELLGAALATTDIDGDGDREIAVGVANGGFSMQGEVRIYEWAGALSLVGTIGGSSSGEMFGYALSNIGDIGGSPGDEMVVGAPFADEGATDTGAASLVTDLAVLWSLSPGVAGAHAGMAVAGARFGLGEGEGYLAAGAPDDGAGAAFVWNATTQALVATLNGAASGDKFGYSVAFHPDANFDNLPDLAVGAPFEAGTGEVNVYDLQNVGTPLLTVPGSPTSRLGWGVAIIGDTNGTGKNELLISAPELNNKLGVTTTYSPPDTNLDPPDVNIGGPLVQDTTVTITVDNLKENADVYFYVGNLNVPSTSVEGWLLDIAGSLGALAAFNTQTGVTGGSASASYTVPFSSQVPPGSTLYFQVVEERGGFVRNSDVESGTVIEQPFNLLPPGDPQVGVPITLETQYGFPLSPTYYFVSFDGPGNEPSGPPFFVSNTGLTNPIVSALLIATGDLKGFTSFTSPIGFPAEWPIGSGIPTAGESVWYSAVSSNSLVEKLDVEGPFTVQP